MATISNTSQSKKWHEYLRMSATFAGFAAIIVGVVLLVVPPSTAVQIALGSGLLGIGGTVVVEEFLGIEGRKRSDELKSRLDEINELERTKYRAAFSLAIRLANISGDPRMVEVEAIEAKRMASVLGIREAVGAYIAQVERDKVPLDDVEIIKDIYYIHGPRVEQAYQAAHEVIQLRNCTASTDAASIQKYKHELISDLKAIGVSERLAEYVEENVPNLSSGPLPDNNKLLLDLLTFYVQNIGNEVSSNVAAVAHFLGERPTVPSSDFANTALKLLNATQRSSHRCQYCYATIQSDEIVCRHCGKRLV